MPPLVPPVVPTGQLNYVDEVIEAALATLGADPNLEIGGNLGVATIEREYPQPNDEPRTYPRAALPALAVSGTLAGPGGWFATMTREIEIEYRVRVVTESGVTRTADEILSRLLENVRIVLLQAMTTFSGTWLTSEATVLVRGEASIDPPKQVESTPFRFHGAVTFPVRVLHPISTGGPV